MWINTLAGLFLFCLPMADVPNYFPNYLQARDAAENRQKPMIIFVSSADCQRCDAAWNAFTKDAAAVNAYVSTRVETENFDGNVIAQLYEAGAAPAWITLDANGKVTSKWNGGWKDASGNPTVYAEPEGGAKPKINDALKTTPSSQPVATHTAATTKATSPTPVPATKQEPVKSTPTPVASSSTTASTSPSGFVLQAGYFGSEANAQKCITDMKAKGCGDYVIKTNMKDGTTYYRVISLSYTTESEANAAMNTAATKGAKVTVKKAAEI